MNNQGRKRKRVDWSEKLRITTLILEEYNGKVQEFLREPEWADKGYKQQRLNEWLAIGVDELKAKTGAKLKKAKRYSV